MRSFIYSLPRSGSAWLSVFLTGRNSFCFHDASIECGSFEELFSSRPEPSVCAVDTAAYLIGPDLPSRLNARQYVLVRPKAEIAASLLKAQMINPHYDLDQEYAQFQRVTHGMAPIFHAQLSDQDYREWIFTEVTDQPYDARRAKAISDMNIQRDLKKFLA